MSSGDFANDISSKIKDEFKSNSNEALELLTQARQVPEFPQSDRQLEA